jgi:HNH endonuclease
MVKERAMTPKELVLFMDKVRRDKRSRCWVWTGALRGDGKYPAFSLNRVQFGAHRLSYIHFVGRIPKGLEIDHLCRNKQCVNPRHLEPVTRKVNAERWGKTKTHCKHGHPFDKKNTYINPRGQRECKECRRQAVRRMRVRG